MLVTTATVGESFRNEPSLSSASATRNSPCPSFALDPRLFSFPPTTAVGSQPAVASTVATIEVVVVFPCVPAIAMPYFIRINSASISARGITGIFRRCDSMTSGLSGRIAEETTTTWPSSGTFEAECPVRTTAPSRSSRSVVSERRRSDPDTRYPRFRRSSAIPLIPIPPIPTKWMGSPFLYIRSDPLPGSVPGQPQRRADRLYGRPGPGEGNRRRSRALPRDPIAAEVPQRRPERLLRRLAFRQPRTGAGSAEFPRVPHLVIVRSERVRNEHARAPEERGLRDGQGSSAHQHGMAAREPIADPVGERKRLHREGLLPHRSRHRLVLPRPRLQQTPYRRALPLRSPGHPQHPGVDRPRPLRPSQRQHGERRLRRSLPSARPRRRDDLRADRVPRDFDPARREERDRARKAREHADRMPRQEPVRAAGHAVLRLQEQRDAQERGGKRDRHRGVSSHAEDQVRATAPQDLHRHRKSERHPEGAREGPGSLPPDLPGGDEVDREPPGRNGPRLETFPCPDEGDDAVGTEGEKRISKGDPRKDVPTGPSPGYDHPQWQCHPPPSGICSSERRSPTGAESGNSRRSSGTGGPSPSGGASIAPPSCSSAPGCRSRRKPPWRGTCRTGPAPCARSGTPPIPW